MKAMTLVFALLLLTNTAAAAEQRSGWSVNLTPRQELTGGRGVQRV